MAITKGPMRSLTTSPSFVSGISRVLLLRKATRFAVSLVLSILASMLAVPSPSSTVAFLPAPAFDSLQSRPLASSSDKKTAPSSNRIGTASSPSLCSLPLKASARNQHQPRQPQSEQLTGRWISGLREIVDNYDMFVLDMWGVMHDGSRPYDGALEAIQMLVQRGKRIVILSNSSKRQDHSIKMLRKLGFDPRDFDMIITSGEVAHQMLSGQGEWLEPCRPWKPLRDLAERDCGVPKKAFCLGSGDGDDVYLRSCGWTLAPPDAADLVVARGTFTVDDGQSAVRKRDNPQWYESELRRTLAIAARRRLPMIVCNPDKVRPDADRPPMPGKIGDLYEEILVNLWGTSLTGDGEELCELVKRVGKPDRDVFDIALTTTALKSKASNRRDLAPTTTTSSSKKAPLTLRACMVGDALETDVVGGSAAGLDTIWVLETGIHGPDLLTRPSSSSPLTAKKAAAQAVLDDFNRQDGTYARGRLLAAAVLIPSFRW